MVMFTFFSNLYAQGRCELFLKKDTLQGDCSNSYFSAFQLVLDDTTMDSLPFFRQLPLKGKVIVEEQYLLDAEFAVTTRAGFPQVIFKCPPGWFTLDSLSFLKNGLTFSIDHDPDVPVTASDLEIILKAGKLLATSDQWQQEDDGNCDDDVQNQVFSLFCALRTASVSVEGSYNHRNAILQKVRHQIEKLYPGRSWEHRLRDFNNMPETNFATIQQLLKNVETAVRKELAQKY